jgi:hypothetical protein
MAIDFEREPSAEELAAIDAEWPQIEADLAALDAEIDVLCAHGQVCELDRRRVRRKGRRALTVSRPVSGVDGSAVAA